jgi:hypothetical protein
MSAFHHYEELRSVFNRMDKVLPGRTEVAEKEELEEGGWDWRKTVIEAKVIRLERLPSLPLPDCEKWRYSGGIPEEHQWSTHRRWYITERTRVTTTTVTECMAPAVDDGITLPPGASLWHGPDAARRLLVLAKHDATSLFDTKEGELGLPVDYEWHTQGFVTLFATQKGVELCYRDCVRLLHPVAPRLTRLVREYARTIGWMFGLSQQEFEEHGRLHITWYKPWAGRCMELMPASPCRYENGPVVHIGVGRPVITHDMAPTLGDQTDPRGCAVRLRVPEGVMVCLDGDSRIRYAHGYPQGNDTKKNWFSLTFFMDCTRQSVAVGYDKETRAVVMATPIRVDRVVASRPSEKHMQESTLRMDLMGSLVKSMRVRLRVAESHILATRYLEAVDVDLKSYSGESKSQSSQSMMVLE